MMPADIRVQDRRRAAHRRLLAAVQRRWPTAWQNVWAEASGDVRETALDAEADRPGAGLAVLEAAIGDHADAAA